MPILTELKKLYVKLGGNLEDVDKYENNTDVINAIAVLYGGEGDATNIADAIINLTAVAENIIDGRDI